jgi:hypothetical protein
MAAAGEVEENGCDTEGLRRERERMVLEEGLSGILVAMMTLPRRQRGESRTIRSVGKSKKCKPQTT